MPFNRKSLDNLKQNRTRPPAEDRAESGAQSVVPESASGTAVQGLSRDSAAGIMEMTAPAAAVVVNRMVNGSIRTAPHVRLDACRMSLEAAGVIGKNAEQRRADDTESLVERLRLALEIRRRKAEAVDA